MACPGSHGKSVADGIRTQSQFKAKLSALRCHTALTGMDVHILIMVGILSGYPQAESKIRWTPQATLSSVMA